MLRWMLSAHKHYDIKLKSYKGLFSMNLIKHYITNKVNEDCYKGEMYNFKKYGNGIMNYTDEIIYKGNLYQDQRHGFGVFT